MIEEGKISAEDGSKLLNALNAAGRPEPPSGGGPTGPMPPMPPMPPMASMPPMPPMPPAPPMPPMPPRPPHISDREWEQIEREHDRAVRDAERAHERALRQYEQQRERAERERERVERERDRGRRDRGERGRGRGGVWIGGGGPDDVFWGQRRNPRDTGPLGEEGTAPGGARWFRVRVTDVRSGKVKVNVSLPMGLINFGLKLGAKYVPEEAGFNLEEIREAVRSGIVGKIISVEDSDDGERVEVFVE
jgi:hypothetical protein